MQILHGIIANVLKKYPDGPANELPPPHPPVAAFLTHHFKAFIVGVPNPGLTCHDPPSIWSNSHRQNFSGPGAFTRQALLLMSAFSTTATHPRMLQASNRPCPTPCLCPRKRFLALAKPQSAAENANRIPCRPNGSSMHAAMLLKGLSTLTIFRHAVNAASPNYKPPACLPHLFAACAEFLNKQKPCTTASAGVVTHTSELETVFAPEVAENQGGIANSANSDHVLWTFSNNLPNVALLSLRGEVWVQDREVQGKRKTKPRVKMKQRPMLVKKMTSGVKTKTEIDAFYHMKDMLDPG